METIVFLDRGSLPIALPVPGFPHRWRDHDQTTPDELPARVADATILISNKVPLAAPVLAAAPRLKFVAVCATGTNNVDLDACRARAIPVSNVRGYANESVPEHVLMLLFALSRSLLAYHADVRAGAWQHSPHFCLATHPARDLAGMTLAVVGSGDLGRGVARLAAALGMRVWQVERKGAAAPRPGYVAWEEAIRQADAITLHCPLTPDTRNLIGAPELAAMKPDALLINTARGGLVDEAALADALRTGRLGGAGIDVLSEEPPVSGNPLLDQDLPNLIVTPHNAWTSRGAMQKMARQLIDNLEAFAAGTPRNRVA
jgi:glycerate dehydrogenase